MKGTLKNSLSSSILVHKAIGRNYILLPLGFKICAEGGK